MSGNLTEVVTALTSTTVAAGGTFSFSARTSNVGNTSTGGGSTSRIFLSVDPVIDPFDTVLQIRTVPTLGAFSEFAQNYVVTLPLNLVPGTYYIGGLADFNNQIDETNEGDNNYNRLTITVTPPPNLTEVVTALTSTTVTAGGSFSFATNTVNNGQTVAAGSTARIFLSTDPIITAQDTLLATHVSPSLNAGQGNAQNFAVNLPANLAPGTYYIGGLADFFNQVGEANEGDNNGNVVTITVPPSAPDLRAVMTALSSTTVTAGGGFSFSLNTVNEGNAVAGPSASGIYLSTDPIITRQDRFMGFANVGQLNPGAGFGGQTNNAMVIPADLAPGTYYFGALADNENQVAESNESNNNGNVIALTVRPSGPDLRAVMTATNGTTFSPGGGLLVFGVNTVNEGNTASTGSTTTLYLSTDPVITRQDDPVGFGPVLALNPGAGYGGQFFMGQPIGYAPGTYYIGALADNEDQVAESNESNNNGNVITITITGANLTAGAEQLAPTTMNASGLQLSQAAASSFVECGGSLAGPAFLATSAGATPDLVAADPTKYA